MCSCNPAATAESPRPLYGGQAVIEGVMIRGVRHYSLAVRRPDGGIFCSTEPVSSRLSGPMRHVPFLRGVLILAETLWLGMKSLQRSAIIAAEEPDADQSGDSDAGQSSVSNWTMGITMAIALVLGIGIFLVLPLLAARLMEPFVASLLVINLIEGVIRLVVLVGYVAGISLMKDIRRVYAYHGAEHMAVHTYEAGEPLTVDNVRRHPTPHPRCGTAFLITVAIVSVAAFAILDALLGTELYWRILSRIVPVPLVAAISYEIIRFAGAHRGSWFGKILSAPGLWLQRITTRQPDADQIEVAIAAMTAAVAADANADAPPNPAPCGTVTPASG
ncbi:MAG: DUF1385 domain-containing protein [Chloroflexi bacterium]|nr:DUF1385 domain-containing protein [Chloroflexota bacterium]MYD46930.1 DUF1385 domain-containing protein [Chloroflexota bacterium]